MTRHKPVRAEFVHLHVHTQYSFLMSTVRVAALPARVRELGMPGVAITDHANMFGALRHYVGCRTQGIQPIIGCELDLIRAAGARADHLPLLAATLEGYRNLIRLVTLSSERAARSGLAGVSLAELAAHARGIVGLTGCLGGVGPQRVLEHGPEAAMSALSELRDVFEPGHLFVELEDHGLPEQPIVNEAMTRAARNLDLPRVATNCVHFVRREDGEAQLYLDCIRRNRLWDEEREHHHGSFEMFLKSPEEMAAAFSSEPELLKNTLRVAELCRSFELPLGAAMLPRFPVPDGYDTNSYFEFLAREGLRDRLALLKPLDPRLDEGPYLHRLAEEIQVITRMNYAGYFLIVWDFIREAKSRGIPVGPGRGSGAGSLVAYSLGITEIDPLPHQLLFERFLNPERVSMPDFDIDFCMWRRDEVIRYVTDKYGRDSVGQIATFQNLKARSVIKDVGRTMGLSAPEAQRVASLVPEKGQGKMCTIAEALEVEPKLADYAARDGRVRELLNQAQKLEGLTRHVGVHAAGVVISDGALFEHVPCFESDGSYVTQYDKDDVEQAGLVKFDFLGLKTLTVIRIAENLVNARADREHQPFDINRIPLDDKATYQLIASGETTLVFQLESSGMQQLLRGLKPDCFEDIVAAVALYRPGPLGTGMIDDFIARKHGRKPVRKLHPLVDELLSPTYGVPVYQEQVMQIAQRLAGYTLGGADLLRRAMGKKKPEEMERQRKTFVEGALGNGVSEEQATSIFNEVEGFAAYGFNKSHSAAYALITFQTAYLKAHYPVEFFAALMTADKDKIDKVVRTIAEARAWGVRVLPPDINSSEVDFTVVRSDAGAIQGEPSGKGQTRRYDAQIRFGLGAVKGVGESALETVLEARREGGPFRDLFDFAARVDAKRLNKGVLDALVQAGAFDSTLDELGITRARAHGAIDRALERSRSASRDRERGQTTLFGLFERSQPLDAPAAAQADEYPPREPWDRLELLARERDVLGCYASGHPLERYGSKLAHIGARSVASLMQLEPWSVVSVAAMIEGYREKTFRSGGSRVGFFELEDMSGRVQAKLTGERVQAHAEIIAAGQPVLVTGKISYPVTDEADEDAVPTLLVDEMTPLSDAVRKQTRLVSLRFRPEQVTETLLIEVRQLLEAFPGACPVEVVLSLPDGLEAVLALEHLSVDPNDRVLSGLERVYGDSVAELQ